MAKSELPEIKYGVAKILLSWRIHQEICAGYSVKISIDKILPKKRWDKNNT